ncbi:glycerate kinase [Amycolatopsis suaedae]|uniref:Glycerate kinase n=1 Tax=Amycolatopsis suaedae TaxID=2510978 RepID=A0A4Q7J285_9PSEU|nr:glycerate kinase [Amycolatopsis suaedae]
MVVAPDKFKGSVTAVQAARAIGEGVRDALPGAEVTLCPVADGGEGTLDVLYAAGATRVDLRVRGPLDDEVDAHYAVLDGTAYVESARACGIEYVRPSTETALAAHTFGVGTLIGHAVDGGADHVVLTVGGTASTDGGAGMIAALGGRIRTGTGAQAGLGGGALGAVTEVDLAAVRERFARVRVSVATDVTNPLLGERGAAAVFGPQKGAGEHEVAVLDKALSAWADALVRAGCPDVRDVPGAGAGGGVAAGALACLGGRVASGFDLVGKLTGVPDAIAGADLVITGEGSLDSQSLDGKAPAGIAALAREHGLPVLAVAGRVKLTPDEVNRLGLAGHRALIEHAPSLEHARRHAAALLREQTAALVREWRGFS